ncbi:MAG: 2-amino-4-hydroxy-6-hydroxymethyldihydropteridine diphosphokinase [Flavobacterium sp.]|nr:2-amino-4-hydroxy-6-hydroxymethyldihydropteridine diphosphokinase [Flavobacterium sp.]
MSTQNTVVLSLGTNLGNRLQNVETAIAMLHKKAGTVVKVSGLYETPSWGFESTPFYNCALVMHTQKEAKQLLEACQSIEVEMGRAHTKPGYEARIIDIDVIAFNEEIISTTTLQVPHPLMQDRLFVLLPMRDLQLDWRHPILQKHLPDLLKASEDKSNCVLVQKLIAPLKSIPLEQYNYIAIEGNIGAGKTTLALKIADDFNAKTVLERFADNPFLPKFYEDQNRYAFPLEMSFLADRYQQISDDLAQFDLFKDFIVADYHIFKSLIFAKVTLTDDEYRLYRKLFEIIYKEMPKPDLYIYLYQNTERLLANIKKRGREYEQEIAPEYLEKINLGYLDYIKSQTDLNVLVIDMSDRDFVQNQEDYVYILSKIQEKLAPNA